MGSHSHGTYAMKIFIIIMKISIISITISLFIHLFKNVSNSYGDSQVRLQCSQAYRRILC